MTPRTSNMPFEFDSCVKIMISIIIIILRLLLIIISSSSSIIIIVLVLPHHQPHPHHEQSSILGVCVQGIWAPAWHHVMLCPLLAQRSAHGREDPENPLQVKGVSVIACDIMWWLDVTCNPLFCWSWLYPVHVYCMFHLFSSKCRCNAKQCHVLSLFFRMRGVLARETTFSFIQQFP